MSHLVTDSVILFPGKVMAATLCDSRVQTELRLPEGGKPVPSLLPTSTLPAVSGPGSPAGPRSCVMLAGAAPALWGSASL